MKRRYETVTLVVDDATIAESDVSTIIHPVWWRADIYNGPEEYERTLEPFSREQRLMFALRWYMCEVNNGGHDQFYSNATGIVWKDACRAFGAIGIKKGADIILASADRLGGEPSLDHDARHAQLDESQPHFDDLDETLYALNKTVDVENAMLTFIRNHAKAFHFSGEITRLVLPKLTKWSTE